LSSNLLILSCMALQQICKDLYKCSYWSCRAFLQIYQGFYKRSYLSCRAFLQMYQDEVKKYVNECPTCIQNGSIKEKSDLVPVVSSGPLEHLQVNLVDLLSYVEHNDRYSYILTLIDIFSHYVWAILIKDKEENTIHSELVNVFKNFGPSTKLQADNRSKFITRTIHQNYSTRAHSTGDHFTRNHFARNYFARDHSPRTLKHIPPENAASQDNEALYELHAMQVKHVHDEVAQNDETYQNKLVIRGSVHRRKVTFELEDKVVVVPDFDNNQKT
ncbi:27806_t:CDS:2, partial [Racocetra persica]